MKNVIATLTLILGLSFFAGAAQAGESYWQDSVGSFQTFSGQLENCNSPQEALSLMKNELTKIDNDLSELQRGSKDSESESEINLLMEKRENAIAIIAILVGLVDAENNQSDGISDGSDFQSDGVVDGSDFLVWQRG